MNHIIRINDEDLETLLLEILYMQQGEGDKSHPPEPIGNSLGKKHDGTCEANGS